MNKIVMIQIMMMLNKFHLMILNLKRKKKIKLKDKILILEGEFLKKYSDNLIKNKASKLNVFPNLNKLNY